MVSLKELYGRVLDVLTSSGIESPRFECDVLFKKHFGLTGYDLMVKDADINDIKASELLADIDRRIKHEPLQYIVGEWDFMGLTFKLAKDVLIPRPDTETVVEEALKKLREIKNPVFADLCTGSGCIAVSLAKLCKGSCCYAVDISSAALAVAMENIKGNGVADRIILKQADVLKGGEDLFEKHSLDLIISNPPYISGKDMNTLSPEVQNEPRIALYGGTDGLDFYRAIIPGYKDYLKPGGYICFEAGYGEADSISDLFLKNGYDNIETKRDLCGIERAVLARKS